MAKRIRALLIVCGLVVVCAVAAIVYIATRPEPNPPLVPTVPTVDHGKVAETPPEAPSPAEPVKPRPPREARKSANLTPPTDEASAAPTSSPEEAVQAEAEKKAREEAERRIREKQEEAVSRLREEVIRDFSLTPEQVAAAEPVIARLQDMVRAFMSVFAEAGLKQLALRRQLQDDRWTPEQKKQLQEQAIREFTLEHQGELLQLFDEAIQGLEDLRPHLTAEQLPKLDKKAEETRQMRDKLLRGEFFRL